MTAIEAKEQAVQARIKAIEEYITGAVNQGLFEIRIDKLTPEQTTYLEENGFKVRHILQKAGHDCHDINWE